MATHDSAKLEFALKNSLEYEIQMLGQTYLRLQLPQTDPLVVNALIELFCIHARLLLEFFDPGRPHPGTILAEEFTGGDYKPAYTSAISDSLRAKLHQQIAHLSENRTDQSEEKIGPLDRTLLHTALHQELVHFFTKVRAHLEREPLPSA